MAMSAAERKRLQIAREKEQARRQMDLVQSLLRPGFGAWAEEACEPDLQHLEICYDGMNRMAPDFTHDTDPVSLTDDFVFPTNEEVQLTYRGALGRAELEVELLLEAAKTLARMINAYKREVITQRLAAIEAEDLSDQTIRSQRLAEVVALTKAIERLEKSVRTDVPQWQLRG